MFLQFYGLSEQPFGVTPDPRFLYMGAAQQEVLSSLVYGIETGRGFMTLIAQPGVGKTMMLLRLMERVRASARTAFLFQSQTTPKEFLRSLLADLDVEPSGQDFGDLQRQLRDVLIREAQSGGRIIVVIDEAQNLDDGILEMVRILSNFETPQAKLLQIVLAGQSQLADKLASPHLEQLRQRVSIIARVPSLDGDDITKYIDHRLRVAGYRRGSLFTPGAIRLIAIHSRGVPRNINNLCFHALSLGYAKNQKKIDDAILREVIADLNLEPLRVPAMEAPEPEPSPAFEMDAADSRKNLNNIGAVAIGPMPLAPDARSHLDAVEPSSNTKPAAGSTRRSARIIPSGGHSGSDGRDHRIRPWVVAGLAIVIACLLSTPWGSPRFNVLTQFAAVHGLKFEWGEKTTGFAPAGTGSSGAIKENAASPGEPSLKPDIPGPIASIVPAVGADETNSSAEDVNQIISQIPRPGATSNHDAFTADARGYQEGTGRLVVESSIRGARITINGHSDPKWVAPRLFSLPSGTCVISVSSPGYLTWTKYVHVDEGRERLITADLEGRDGAVFTVETDPPGMQVFIDGKPFGPSRVETVLHPGWHVCEIVPGAGLQTLVRKIHLNPGEALTKNIRLRTVARSSELDKQNQVHRGESVE